ncbi:biotin synthase [Pleodorina starrii]|uniref:biotin synthase n=1 Tax=Pleodorina starrii TaxID=330485 RepID=A0A9W6C045_9CHLO|nr:biotin synthase [Pleodorina starrii]GLC69366.1 biotin synthase [Pleodorina starrii]
MSQVALFARSVLCSGQQAAGVSVLRKAFLRAFNSSSSTLQAEPLPVASEPAPSVPRWIRELGVVRTDWTRDEVAEVYNTPLLDLVYRAASVHRMYNDPSMVQRCTLLSIKTGGCPENCNYCSQSSHWSKDTGMKAEKLMDLEEVYQAALRARDAGSTRFCMGAAWRGPSQVGQRQWERVLEMIRRIRGLGMEVCTTLGMLTPEQASQLRQAGLTAYNHNLDTSPEYYEKITSTRKYEDRLTTLEAVREAGISVCAGGIIGLGEGPQDRVGLIHQLATLPAHPESVPINRLVAIKGTPLQDQAPPEGLDLVRCVATARVVMPRTVVRLSAGRLDLSRGDQALAFLAGANSIFDGDKLLTTPNNDRNEDLAMFEQLGLRSRPAFLPYASGNETSRSFEDAGSGGGGGCGSTAAEAAPAAEAMGGGCCGGGAKKAAVGGGCC